METLYDVYIKIFGYGQIKLICDTNDLKNTCENYIRFYKKKTQYTRKLQ